MTTPGRIGGWPLVLRGFWLETSPWSKRKEEEGEEMKKTVGGRTHGRHNAPLALEGRYNTF